MIDNESRNLIGCCGLYCGLCSKYQSKAPSRCIGCKKGEQHSWCSIWNCCVKKHRFETCAECGEVFRCKIFLRRKIMDDPEWFPAPDNLRKMIEIGSELWLKEQIERQTLLETLLQNYNEGRSMSFFCKVSTRMPVVFINKAIKEANKKLINEKVNKSDMKSRAKILKEVIKNLALKVDVNLGLK